MALSIGFKIFSCLPSCYSSYGAWTLTPVGLSPTVHASLRWTHTFPGTNAFKSRETDFTVCVVLLSSPDFKAAILSQHNPLTRTSHLLHRRRVCWIPQSGDTP